MAAPKPGPRGPDAVKGPAVTERGPDADRGPDAVEPAFFETVAEVQAIVDEANDPLPSAPPPPKWVRVTIPDYPNVTHLLFHWDGTVTWK